MIKKIVTFLLIIGGIIILANLASTFIVPLNKIYYASETNLIVDGSFENFNDSAKDCCNDIFDIPHVSASKTTDAYSGNYALKLESASNCACINKKINPIQKNGEYLISFYYKGDNPKFCNWVIGEDLCLPLRIINGSQEWKKHTEFLKFTDNSLASRIYFYTDSKDKRKYVNYYDDLQVRKLIEIDNNYNFQDNEEYIIETKADNNINGERISDIENGEAYFLIQGEPKVTIKFPITELIIILIMLIIIIRLTKHEKH